MTEADLAALMAADAARIRKDPRHAVNRGNYGISSPQNGKHQREAQEHVVERKNLCGGSPYGTAN